jgi:hypothetical protein
MPDSKESIDELWDLKTEHPEMSAEIESRLSTRQPSCTRSCVPS